MLKKLFLGGCLLTLTQATYRCIRMAEGQLTGGGMMLDDIPHHLPPNPTVWFSACKGSSYVTRHLVQHMVFAHSLILGAQTRGTHEVRRQV